MNTARPAGERDIDAIVDDNSCPTPGGQSYELGNEVGKLSRLEVALPDLHCIYAGLDRMSHLRHKAGSHTPEVATPRDEAASIGDEVDHHFRAMNSGTSSERAASRFSRPSPLMAPRT